MPYVWNVFTGNLDFVDKGGNFWKDPVADKATLDTITTDVDGSVRIVTATNDAYRWNLGASQWQYIGEVKTSAVGSSPNANAFSVAADNTLTLQPASGSFPGIITTGSQTLAGSKTLSSTLNADGGIDRSTSGTLSFGVGTNSATINIGNAGATVNIQGTTIFENVTTLQIADPLITLNKGGAVGSGAASGIEIEENSLLTGYVKTSGDRNSWTFKAPATNGIISLTPGASNDVVVLRNTTDTLTNKSIDATTNTLTNISNASIATSAAIAYSKLALTNSVVNADINASAAIAYSKLNLSASIVNADINASAAIAYSKLTLTNSIVNADINSSAAIAYSKLNLLASIVNADVASGAAIAVSKLAALTASRAVVTDGSGFISASATTSAQVGFLSTVTSDVQTQINNKLGRSAGDIDETSFAPANSQVAPANVTGLAFANATVRSAKVNYSIFINATTPLYEAGELLLIQKGSSWEMSQTTAGDVSLITLSVTTAGQIQYTTPTYTGFSSAKMQFRAITTTV